MATKQLKIEKAIPKCIGCGLKHKKEIPHEALELKKRAKEIIKKALKKQCEEAGLKLCDEARKHAKEIEERKNDPTPRVITMAYNSSDGTFYDAEVYRNDPDAYYDDAAEDALHENSNDDLSQEDGDVQWLFLDELFKNE